MEHFEQIGTRGFYRPVARVNLHRGLDMMADAGRVARDRGLKDLLINTTRFSGYEPPTIFDRYSWATRLAASVGASVRVATVLRPDIVDPQKIGVLMAQNRGVKTEIFTTEAEALAWLDAGAGERRPPRARSS